MSNSNLIDEDKIPDTLKPVDTASVKPGAAPAPPVPNDMPQFFSGSMPPALQHDVNFVGTKLGTPRIPQHSLMPFGQQGSGFTNAATQSTVIKEISSGGGPAITLKTNGSNNPNQSVLDLEPGTSNVSLSADGSGAVRISVSASGASKPAYLQIQSGRVWSDAVVDISSAPLAVGHGMATGLTFGTAGGGGSVGPAFTTTQTPFSTLQGGSSAFGAANIYTTTAVMRWNANPLLSGSFSVPMVTHLRVWFGLFSTIGNNLRTGDNMPPGEFVAFLADTSTYTNWQCTTQNGAQNFVDSGVAVDHSNHVFTIVVDSTAGSATYFIDGVQVGVNSTDIPSATTALRPIMYAESIQNLGVNTDIVYFKSYYAEEDVQ